MIDWDERLEEQNYRKGTGNNLLIVDGINLAMRFKHRGATVFGVDYLALINSLANSYGAKTVIHLSDFGKSTYRKEILPTYKGAREEKRAEQSEEETQKWEEFFEGYQRAVELLEKAGHISVKLRGVEADDLATYFVLNLKDTGIYDTIWLVSTDVDWDQLLSHNVKRWAYTTQKEFTLDNFYEEHGCDTPEQLTQIKAIQGDRGDSIIGVDGIGIKRAYNLIREYGTVFDLIGVLPLSGTQQYIKKLNAAEDIMLRNLELVDLPSYYLTAIYHASTVYKGSDEYVTHLENIVNNIMEKYNDRN